MLMRMVNVSILLLIIIRFESNLFNKATNREANYSVTNEIGSKLFAHFSIYSFWCALFNAQFLCMANDAHKRCWKTQKNWMNILPQRINEVMFTTCPYNTQMGIHQQQLQIYVNNSFIGLASTYNLTFSTWAIVGIAWDFSFCCCCFISSARK